jgi:putative PIN family toxin of toxin-antitoxin system
MIVVLDTNILLVSLKSNSKYSKIFEYLINEKYELAISNEILFEYFEIIERKTTGNNAQNVINLLISLPNVRHIEPYYKWHLINKDESDNKFVDCAITANAAFIVTEDKDFNEVKSVDFPKINVIGIVEFMNILLN